MGGQARPRCTQELLPIPPDAGLCRMSRLLHALCCAAPARSTWDSVTSSINARTWGRMITSLACCLHGLPRFTRSYCRAEVWDAVTSSINARTWGSVSTVSIVPLLPTACEVLVMIKIEPWSNSLVKASGSSPLRDLPRRWARGGWRGSAPQEQGGCPWRCVECL